jgi:hypothetical protein
MSGNSHKLEFFPGSVVLERILKDFFLFKQILKWFSLLLYHPIPMAHDCKEFDSALRQRASMSRTFLPQWFLRRFFPYKHVRIVSPFVAPPDPREVMTFNRIDFALCHVNFNLFGSVVLEQKIFIIFSTLQRHVKMVFRIVVPTYPKGP